MKTWYIQRNNGTGFVTDVRAEARFYAWLSIDYSLYNVYSDSCTLALLPYEI